MITVYGIKNCDTVKKARAWLDANAVPYRFHDYKAAGIDAVRLQQWSAKVGWEVLLNRSGTSFRALPDADKQGIDQAKAIALMIGNPSMIKRPVLEHDGTVLVGFNPEIYASTLR